MTGQSKGAMPDDGTKVADDDVNEEADEVLVHDKKGDDMDIDVEGAAEEKVDCDCNVDGALDEGTLELGNGVSENFAQT